MLDKFLVLVVVVLIFIELSKLMNELLTWAVILFGVEKMLKGFLKFCVFVESLSVT